MACSGQTRLHAGQPRLAVVLVLDQDAVQLVHAVDAEQAEVDALHAVGAAAVVDDRIPAALRLLQQLLRRESSASAAGRSLPHAPAPSCDQGSAWLGAASASFASRRPRHSAAMRCTSST